ncbi:MAG: hypothetical protein QOF78_3952 [Phycisphaerales bacterium]|jgi:hypothetical protein|nr:hypothetical protein [Phycisphaerales bacterium]
MMRVVSDANIVLDVLLKRRPLDACLHRADWIAGIERRL